VRKQNHFDHSVRVDDVVLKSPVLLASGTAGHADELEPYFPLSNIGAIVVKSMSSFEWAGNKAPRLRPTNAGMLNAVGLQGRGVAHWIEHDLPRLKKVNATIVASIWGFSIDDYRSAASLLSEVSTDLAAIEINLSCPNIGSSSKAENTRHGIFAHDENLSAEIVKVCADAKVPLWAKLSPNTDRVVDVAAACQAVTLINTALGLAIDVETGLPALGNGGGGLSGSGIHPIAVRTIFDVRSRLPRLPIIGVGGISNGKDAIEMLMAGASCIQVGTATFADPRAAMRIDREMRLWARKNGVSNWSEVVNAAHKGGLATKQR
jgi:dihydroorotate dehydrogenase (NAD+) catalytic subunit